MAARNKRGATLRLLAAALCAASALAHAAVGAQQGDTLDAAQFVARVRDARATEATFTEAQQAAFALVGAARYEEALAIFAALAERRPRDATALYGAALANFNLHRVAEAEPLARAAVDVALGSAPSAAAITPAARQQATDAFVLLAVIEAVRGDNAAALREAQRAVELAPAHFDAQFTLGRARYGAGDPAGAALAFRAAVALRPVDARARFFLATALERAGDEAGALAAYRELVARAPGFADGHTGLGVLLVKRGGAGTTQGLQELARAVALDPEAYEARVTLGRTLVQQGRAAEAVEHLQRAAQLAPANPEPHYQLARAYRRLGRAAEAAAESNVVRQIHEARRQASNRRNTASPPD